jgi:hypothetical protein
MSTSLTSAAAPPAPTRMLPSAQTLENAAKIAIDQDKPIMLDYYVFSLEKKAMIGVKTTGEKLLVKSEEEYTSSISKIYQSGTDLIVLTENSIYLVSAQIPKRTIT